MLIIRRIAKQEIRQAKAWYSSIRPALGRRLVTELDGIFEKIEEAPERYAFYYGKVRRALCSTFPYALFFISDSKGVTVLAFQHQSRHPTAWMEGLKERDIR